MAIRSVPTIASVACGSDGANEYPGAGSGTNSSTVTSFVPAGQGPVGVCSVAAVGVLDGRPAAASSSLPPQPLNAIAANASPAIRVRMATTYPQGTRSDPARHSATVG